MTAVFNNTAGSSYYSVHANATGWSKGTIHVSYNLYVGTSSTGPWSYVGGDSNSCTSSTSCSTATSYGSCTDGWYKLVAEASGPGGTAENTPSVKIKHVHGVISTAVTDSLGSSCRYITQPI